MRTCNCLSIELFHFGCKCGYLNKKDDSQGLSENPNLFLNCIPGAGVIRRLKDVAEKTGRKLLVYNCVTDDIIKPDGSITNCLIINVTLNLKPTIVYFDQLDQADLRIMKVVNELMEKRTIQGKSLQSNLFLAANYYNCNRVPLTKDLEKELTKIK
jgi:hypothetical protein